MKTNKNYLFNSIAIIFLALSLIFQALTISKLSDRIEKLEEAKTSEKIKMDPNQKKLALNVDDLPPIYDGNVNITQRGSFNIGVIKSTSSARFVMLDYIISIGQPDGNTSNVYYTIDVDVSLSDTFNNSSYTELNVVRDTYTNIFFTSFTGTHDIPLERLKHFQCNFIPSVFKNTDSNGDEKLYFHLDIQLDFTAVNNTITYEEIRLNDYVVSGFNTLNLAFITTNNYHVIFDNVKSQLVFYYNGYEDGKIDGYEDGKIDGIAIGEKSKNTFTLSWLSDIFDVVDKILSVEIFYGFKLWYFVGIIGLIGVIYGVMKLWR